MRTRSGRETNVEEFLENNNFSIKLFVSLNNPQNCFYFSKSIKKSPSKIKKIIFSERISVKFGDGDKIFE